MRLGFLTSSISKKGGGLTQAVRGLALELIRHDLGFQVFALEDEAQIEPWTPVIPHLLPTIGPSAFGYAPGLIRILNRAQLDVLHVHGLWMFPDMAALTWRGRAHLISPHGMLDPWALNISPWKKRIASWFFQTAHLRKAACLQALCESELQSIRAYGLRNPVCLIPNGVEIPPNQDSDFENDRFPSAMRALKAGGHKVLLYLGRLHPKKGLVNLVRAWSAVTRSRTRDPAEWLLAIAGWNQGGHERELKELASALNISWINALPETRRLPSGDALSCPAKFLFPDPGSLVFLGPLFGPEKEAALGSCDAFILPSRSEGLPMAVLEAWSHSKPVLITPECNLPEGFGADAAVRIHPDVASIAGGLEELFRAPSSALHTVGGNGHKLVRAKFTWPQIARDMRSVYDWILGGGPRPGCVVI